MNTLSVCTIMCHPNVQWIRTYIRVSLEKLQERTKRNQKFTTNKKLIAAFNELNEYTTKILHSFTTKAITTHLIYTICIQRLWSYEYQIHQLLISSLMNDIYDIYIRISELVKIYKHINLENIERSQSLNISLLTPSELYEYKKQCAIARDKILSKCWVYELRRGKQKLKIITNSVAIKGLRVMIQGFESEKFNRDQCNLCLLRKLIDGFNR